MKAKGLHRKKEEKKKELLFMPHFHPTTGLLAQPIRSFACMTSLRDDLGLLDLLHGILRLMPLNEILKLLFHGFTDLISYKRSIYLKDCSVFVP